MKYKQILVTQDFMPPKQSQLGRYVLRPLLPQDVEADCVAVNENIDLIRRTRGGVWPRGPVTVEEDLADLKEHERLFAVKEAFAYIISDDARAYLGCLYIFPPNHPFDDTDKTDMPSDTDAVISFWVVGSAYPDIYAEIYHLVPQWLRANWPFKHPYIVNVDKPPRP